MRERSLRGLFFLGLLSSLGACSAAPGGEQTAASATPIKGGTQATAYPEAALVDLYAQGQGIAFCSGSIIAPQVVLTAGHCVMGETGIVPDSWVVTAPYMGRQSSPSSGSAVYDWQTTMGNVDPTKHDIALVFLSTPIKISGSQCPALATKELADNSNVVNIGRIDSGQLSSTDLFVSGNVPVQDGAQDGFPLSYAAQDYIEQGDSGGPDEVPGSSPHMIVAVNSGAGTSGEILARVDLLNNSSVHWIAQQIASHGGPCTGASAPPDAGTGGRGGSSSGGGSGSGSGSRSGSGNGGGSAADGNDAGGGSGAVSGSGAGGNGAAPGWGSPSQSGGGCSVSVGVAAPTERYRCWAD